MVFQSVSQCLPYQVEVAAAAVDSPVGHSCCTAAVEGPVHASASSVQLETCTPSRLVEQVESGYEPGCNHIAAGEEWVGHSSGTGVAGWETLGSRSLAVDFVPVSTWRKLCSELNDLRRSAVVLGRVSLLRGSVAVLGRGAAVAVLVVLLAGIVVGHDGREVWVFVYVSKVGCRSGVGACRRRSRAVSVER